MAIGFWQKIKEYAQSGSLPTAGVLFVDDHGYVDLMKVDDSAGSGHSCTDLTNGAAFTGLVYNYALGYVCNLGMLQNTGNFYVAWGRDSARAWCNQNLNYIPQWGDHEFYNDLGWTLPTASVALPETGAKAATMFASGKTAWNAFMQPLQPTDLTKTLDATSNHWGYTIGPLKVVAPDMISKGDGTGISPVTTVYGNNQIDDILAYLNSSTSPFNILCMSNSVRHLSASGIYLGNTQGAQHPLFDHCLPEYQRLFTNSSTNSIMNSVKTNGISGATILLHGDMHHACVLEHKNVSYALNNAEMFYSVHLGSINGSINTDWNAIAEGESYGGTTVEYLVDGWGLSTHHWHGMRIDVFGSYKVKELHIILMDETGNEVWHGRWLEKSSNDSFPTSWIRPNVIMGGPNF